ncbi:hypothetical protein PHLCEN_2v1608 [Hermanssonia centrifuga]|uniref:Uncharacterized protein n=1 Tax=Hermanssonia centrifuga TaxID=98765 RepID=A0A2R6RZK6_9APHY|nr:hypothetical protein PHLCEN_2v1608 [Hermanssonia centrifuga]
MPPPLPQQRNQAPLSPMSSPHSSSSRLQPPPFARRQSSRNTRLHLPQRQEDPPIPPRLVGSPLLNNLISSNKPIVRNDRVQQPEVWIDGDEFGTHRSRSNPSGADVRRSAQSAGTSIPPPPPGFAVSPTYSRCDIIEAHGVSILLTVLRYSSRGVPA